MHTISSTGPGLLTRAVYDCLTHTESSSDTSSSELMQSVLVLPYFAFTPVPNTVYVDIADVAARTALKEQYIIHPFFDSKKRTTNESKGTDTDSSNGLIIESNTTCTGDSVLMDDSSSFGSRTYAVHWWQRSWQT